MNLFTVKKMALGLATFVPGMLSVRRRLLRNQGGAFNPRYCYAVWLRHLVAIHDSGLSCCPETVAELGPGNSLGVGIAALLSGARRYWAFDVQKDCDTEHNLEVLDQLVELFSRRSPVPDDAEFPGMSPKLNCYDFPARVVSHERLAESLQSARIEAIRQAIRNAPSGGDDDGVELRYMVPWEDTAVIRGDTVDLVLSQAVMEHVERLEHAYATSFAWLKPCGIASHTIDFRCHGSAPAWNGHWTYSPTLWKLIKGRKPFMINRAPLSRHLDGIAQAGFRVVALKPAKEESNITRAQLAKNFKQLTDEDLTTRGTHVILIKP